MKFLKENWKILTIIFLIAVLFPIIILYPSDYGVIPHDVGLQIVGYGGSILGGFLTLYGVWWTIKDSENRRKLDISIEYKPIIIPKENPKAFSSLINEKYINLSFKLKNIGRGEAFNVEVIHNTDIIKTIVFLPKNEIFTIHTKIDHNNLKNPIIEELYIISYTDLYKKIHYKNNLIFTINLNEKKVRFKNNIFEDFN